MLLIMKQDASLEEISALISYVQESGFKVHLSQRSENTVLGILGDTRSLNPARFGPFTGLQEIVPTTRPFKLASREFIPEDSIFSVGNMQVGGDRLAIIAGPCSVEDRSLMLEIACAVREAGASALRGGAFKPRSSPYSFQGMGEKGLELLAEARQVTGLPVVTEVITAEQVPLVARYADMLQIGARNMQNFALLHAAGESQHPVLLKRGMSATVEDLLMAAEYILSHDNRRVVLCERGIRTFETSTRNTTDINAIPVLKSLTHLPVILDPSHSTGHAQYVAAIARAGIAAGADGLIVEVHTRPEVALSDGGQSLTPERFAQMVRQVRSIGETVGRTVAAPIAMAPALQFA